VARWVCEKIAQNIVNPFFVKINPYVTSTVETILCKNVAYFWDLKKPVQSKQWLNWRKFDKSGHTDLSEVAAEKNRFYNDKCSEFFVSIPSNISSNICLVFSISSENRVSICEEPSQCLTDSYIPMRRKTLKKITGSDAYMLPCPPRSHSYDFWIYNHNTSTVVGLSIFPK
jgi:hypothetical protein